MVWRKLRNLVCLRKINFTWVLWWILVAVFFGYLAFVDTNQVDYSTCEKYDVIIKDLSYDSTQRVSWAIISTDIGEFYYQFTNMTTSKDEYQVLEELRNLGSKVTIAISEQPNIRRILGIRILHFFDTENAIDIRNENEVIFSINDYNKAQKEDKVTFVSLFAVYLLLSITWFVIYMVLTQRKQ